MPNVLAGLSRFDPERIRHVASPLIELGCALHVLAEPRHHGRTDWAAGVRLSDVLRDELAQWSWTVRAIRSRCFATSSATGMPTWQDELDALRSREAEDLAADLIRPLRGLPSNSRTTDTDAVLRWARSRGRSVGALVEASADRPGRASTAIPRAARQLLGRSGSRKCGSSPRDDLAARGRQDRDLAVRDGVAAMLCSLDGAISVRDKDSLLVQKVQNKRIDLAERSLLLVPSNYIAPHLFLGEVPGEPLTVIYTAVGRGARRTHRAAGPQPPGGTRRAGTPVRLPSRCQRTPHRGRNRRPLGPPPHSSHPPPPSAHPRRPGHRRTPRPLRRLPPGRGRHAQPRHRPAGSRDALTDSRSPTASSAPGLLGGWL